MTDETKILEFPSASKSKQTITVSYPHFLLLLDAFADCARGLQAKLTLLDDLNAMLPGNDEVGTRKIRERSREEHEAVEQVLTDLREMRAEAEEQAD